MISAACKYRGRHNWDNWELKHENERPNAKFWYYRECQNMGCEAREEAWQLEPVGETRLIEPDENGYMPCRRSLIWGRLCLENIADKPCPHKHQD